MVDWEIKSVEFLVGVKQTMRACMASGVEGGKQVVREQVAT